MSERRNDLGQTESEFRSAVESFGAQDRIVRLPVLDRVTDVVLNYHPKPKKKKKRKRAKKHDA